MYIYIYVVKALRTVGPGDGSEDYINTVPFLAQTGRFMSSFASAAIARLTQAVGAVDGETHEDDVGVWIRERP